MIYNYLKIAYRNITRYKLISFINLFGSTISFQAIKAAVANPLKSLRSE